MNIENLVYPGRFQPFTLGHLLCLEEISRKYKPKKIVIAFPENLERNQENPFLAAETRRIVELSSENLETVEVMGVKMESGLYELWKQYIRDFPIDLVVTGNETMSRVINVIGRGKTRAICFEDGSVSPIRASTVRKKMREGDEKWKEMMVPEAMEYIKTLEIEWQRLPITRKRWYN